MAHAYHPLMDLNHDACYRAVCARDARFDGRFFTAVKTTRIYCRPICPARTPLQRNVAFYPSAAAAQLAGFRPCLRCRPETAPDIGAWRGTSSSVARALSLIEAGALDNAGLDALAERLGLGERQLRRLFHQHLGASPKAISQTRRILLAKQLIHDTQLPMTDVAFAAGFNSIRRFNETFQELFNRPPGALRRERSVGSTASISDQIELLLPYKPPYDWPAILEFLRRRAIAGIELVGENSYSRSIALNGVTGTVLVRPAYKSERTNTLHATVQFPALAMLPSIIARLRRVFDLAADPHAIAAHLATDPMLAPLIKARPGLRVPGGWDGFELAIRAVLGQQITVVAAARLAARLIAQYGEPLPVPHAGLTHSFPLPETIAAADLTTLGMPRSRAQTLSAVAAATIANPQLFDARNTLEAAVAQLRMIRGIGEWTAQYIALRQLREPDAFPAADVALQRAISQLESRSYSAVQLFDRASLWSPWRAYAAQHLWSSL